MFLFVIIRLTRVDRVQWKLESASFAKEVILKDII